jgi:hypothetical protein
MERLILTGWVQVRMEGTMKGRLLEPDDPEVFEAVMAHIGAMSPEQLERYIVRMPEGAVEMETMQPRPLFRSEEANGNNDNDASPAPRLLRAPRRISSKVKAAS